MERCPICKARLKDTPICPRCSTDLSMSLNIERQAEFLFYQAVALLKVKDLSRATKVVEQSFQLKRKPLALALQGFIQSLK